MIRLARITGRASSLLHRASPVSHDEPSTQVLDARRLRRRGDFSLTPTFTMIEGPGIGVLHVLDSSRRAHRLGRSEQADIQIQDPSVSRYHAIAIVSRLDGERAVRIEDNGSTNGTKVNGESLREAWLANGDKLRLGDILLRFQWMTDNEIQYASGVSSKLIKAAKDPLTGFHTRAFVQDRLPSLIYEAERRHLDVCCVLLDLDRFKRINDAHGHLVGDAVIRRASRAVQDALRTTDYGVRYGGEEFLMVLMDAGLSEALEAADRLRQAVNNLDFSDLVEGLRVTVSQGIAQRSRNEPVDAWIERADQALYRAKNQGRDRVVLAESAQMLSESAQTPGTSEEEEALTRRIPSLFDEPGD